MFRKKIEKNDIEDGYEADAESESESESELELESKPDFDILLAHMKSRECSEMAIDIETKEQYQKVLDVLKDNPRLGKLELRGSFLGPLSVARLGEVLVNNTHLNQLNIGVSLVGKEKEQKTFLCYLQFNSWLAYVELRFPKGQEQDHKQFDDCVQAVCQEKRRERLPIFFLHAKQKAAQKELQECKSSTQKRVAGRL